MPRLASCIGVVVFCYFLVLYLPAGNGYQEMNFESSWRSVWRVTCCCDLVFSTVGDA